MPKLWALGTTPAHKTACTLLEQAGFQIEQRCAPDIQAVFLDVPSFRTPLTTPEALLRQLPPGCAVIGGGLDGLEAEGPKMDLLRDPEYTVRNADITARCAIRLATGRLERTLSGLPVLILGWGRIGKCLARLLRCLDAEVWVYARQARDRAMLTALGYPVLTVPPEEADLSPFRLILNTAPAPLLSEAKTALCQNALLLDLASQPGMAGDRVISARGLPGLLAPESAGQLMAETILRLWKEEAL